MMNETAQIEQAGINPNILLAQKNEEIYALQQQQLNQTATILNLGLKLLSQKAAWFLCLLLVTAAWTGICFVPDIPRIICGILFTGTVYTFLKLEQKGNQNGRQ